MEEDKDFKDIKDIKELKDADVDEGTDDVKDKRAKYNKFALIGILLAIASWVILTFNGQVALGCSAVALICGCAGLKSSTRSWRNTAITAVVASAVLLIVLSAFLILIYVGLK